MSDAALKSVEIRKLHDFVAKFQPPDSYTGAARDYFLHALQLLPMAEVLDRLPGKSIIAKCEAAGISRNTWYAWYEGRVRPNKEQAERVAKLTGIPADKFAGRR